MSAYQIGLDLGALADASVLTATEAVEHYEPTEPATFGSEAGWATHHHVGAILRWEGVNYPRLVEEVAQWVAGYFPPLSPLPRLVVDRTGVGLPVLQLFQEAYRAGRLRAHVQGLTITSGRDDGRGTVSKVNLIGRLTRLLGEGRIHIPSTLPNADRLRAELISYRHRMTASGADAYGDESTHDDHVLSLALAVYHRRPLSTPRRIVEALT